MHEMIRRMRLARRRWVDIDGVGFELQRPTALEISELRGRGNRAFLEQCIVDWRGVREIDLVPGGSSDVAPFAPDVAVEYLGDRPHLSARVSEEIARLIEDHAERMKAGEGN